MANLALLFSALLSLASSPFTICALLCSSSPFAARIISSPVLVLSSIKLTWQQRGEQTSRFSSEVLGRLARVAVFTERVNSSNVKVTMARARYLLVLLLPAIWFLGSLPSAANSVSGFAAKDRTALCASTRQNRDFFKLAAAKQTARRLNRRANLCGPDSSSASSLLSPRFFRLSEEFALWTCRTSAPLHLANCWQFHCRMALTPRAPAILV